MPNRAKVYRPAPTTKRPSPSDVSRGTREQRGYTWRWRQFAKLYLRSHPLCVACADRNRVTAATCVDHADGNGPNGDRGYDEANLRALCQSCHSRKTATEDGGFGRKPKARGRTGPG